MSTRSRDPGDGELLMDADSRRAIHLDLDDSLLVEAAAGTGKTTCLVRRIAALLGSGKTTVDRVAAVTFTRKAAGELKVRIRQELDQQRRHAPPDSPAKEHLTRAISRLEEARIGTIHSFCADLLRERPVEAGIDPLFSELSEEEAPALFGQTFQRWIQEKLDDLPTGLARAMAREPGIDRQTQPLDRLKDAAWKLAEWRDYPEPWSAGTLSRFEEIDALIALIMDVAQKSATGKTREKLFKALAPVRDLSHEVDNLERDGRRDYDHLEGRLVRLARDISDKRKPKATGRYSDAHSLQEMLGLWDRLASDLRRFVWAADANLAAELQRDLGEVVERYQARKRASGRLDYVDLLLEARNLLRDDIAVRAYFRGRISHIFVDEFQDTDPLQMEILLLLSADDDEARDWRDVRPIAGKLFLVGDPKQSIYRFRRADVVLYQEVRRHLAGMGVRVLELSHSFRATAPLQSAINHAFSAQLREDPLSGQPEYVPLSGGPASTAQQPSLIALPAPHIHGAWGVKDEEILESHPPATGAFIQWLIEESGWTVRDPTRDDARVPIEPRHIAILARRQLAGFRGDISARYVRELESRSIPHVLVGNKSLANREEVDALRAFLSAIEWPDDALSVYAALRGPFVAIPDDVLFTAHAQGRSLHPLEFDPAALDGDLAAIQSGLRLIARMHEARNARPVAETIFDILDSTRAHAHLALRPNGEQVLANLGRLMDRARVFEMQGGLSFRSFVQWLNAEVQKPRTTLTPVIEEGTEGVRLMTVHTAKGLEFPIVILADPTCPLSFAFPDRYVDRARGLAAVRLLQCSPQALLDNREIERVRDEAEGVRLAYVAATRARDLLVFPGIGSGAGGFHENKWLSPLHRSFYPATESFQAAEPAPGCPEFAKETVFSAPEWYPERKGKTIRPGLHHLASGALDVVWWDPAQLRLTARPAVGVRHGDYLANDAPAENRTAGIERYEAWRSRREDAREIAETQAVVPFRASDALLAPSGPPIVIEEVSVPRDDERVGGRRFGTLVHALLAEASFEGETEDTLIGRAQANARILGATPKECAAAAQSVAAALAHPVFDRVRGAACVRRELPIVFETEDGARLDAVIDLAFSPVDDEWIVVDYKTDADPQIRREQYLKQVQWYVRALGSLTGAKTTGVIVSL